MRNKVYVVDAHTLLDQKDPKSGHVATIDEMKAQIEKKSGIPPTEQRLVFQGTELKDGTAVTDYPLQNNSTVFLNPKPVSVKIRARVRGGGKPKEIEFEADQSYTIQQVKRKHKLKIPCAAYLHMCMFLRVCVRVCVHVYVYMCVCVCHCGHHI